MLENGDQSIIKKLYGFSSQIKGSQQFFSNSIKQAVNFLRHIRITSGNKEMFNVFLTFSLADFHERALHEKLPGSEEYLNKKVITDIRLVPEGEDPSEYIDEKTDFQLRMKVVNENQDIVNAYLIKKVELLFKHVLAPIFGGKHFIGFLQVTLH